MMQSPLDPCDTSGRPLRVLDMAVQFNIVGVALALALGTAAQNLVFSFSNDFLIPGVGTLFGNHKWLSFEFRPKLFMGNTLSFLLVCLVTWVLLKTMLRPIAQESIDQQNAQSCQQSKYFHSSLETLSQIRQQLAALRSSPWTTRQ